MIDVVSPGPLADYLASREFLVGGVFGGLLVTLIGWSLRHATRSLARRTHRTLLRMEAEDRAWREHASRGVEAREHMQMAATHARVRALSELLRYIVVYAVLTAIALVSRSWPQIGTYQRIFAIVFVGAAMYGAMRPVRYVALADKLDRAREAIDGGKPPQAS